MNKIIFLPYANSKGQIIPKYGIRTFSVDGKLLGKFKVHKSMIANSTHKAELHPNLKLHKW